MRPGMKASFSAHLLEYGIINQTSMVFWDYAAIFSLDELRFVLFSNLKPLPSDHCANNVRSNYIIHNS